MSSFLNVSNPAGSKVLTPEMFGADPTGARSSATAFSNMFAQKDVLGSATIVLGANATYLLDAAVQMGVGPFIMQGSGWQTTVVQALGNAAWTAANSVIGSVIRCTSPGGLIMTVAAPNTNWGEYILQNFAIIGDGISAHGIWFNGSGGTGTRAHCSNLFVANFVNGFTYTNFEDCVAYNLYAYGCTSGYRIDGGSTDIETYNVNVQKDTDGILLTSVTGIHFWGGLIQANTGHGVNMVPAAGGGGQLSIVNFDGVWCEANTTNDFLFDTTSNFIESVTFSNCKTDSSNSFGFAGANAVRRLVFGEGCTFGGAKFTLPATVVSGELSPGADLELFNNFVTPNQATNNSSFVRPRDLDAISDFNLPANSAGFVLAAQWTPGGSGAPMGVDFTVDVVGVNPTTSDVGSWRNLRASYVISGAGVFTAVGAEIGTPTPTVNTAGAAAWQLQVLKNAATNTFQVYVFANNVANITDWKIRIQANLAV